jgi:hypothetical protein
LSVNFSFYTRREKHFSIGVNNAVDDATCILLSFQALLIGHVPPGVFEKHLNWSWYRPHYNQLFIALLRKHSDVIGSAFFAHHHTDTFRLVRNETG